MIPFEHSSNIIPYNNIIRDGIRPVPDSTPAGRLPNLRACLHHRWILPPLILLHVSMPIILSYQIAYKSHERALKTELGLSFFSAAFLSVGIVLLFLAMGVYL